MQSPRHAPPSPPIRPKKDSEKKAGKFAFLLSALFHGSILLLIGGVVLIPAAARKAAFSGDPTMATTQESLPDSPPDSASVNNELPTSQMPQENLQVPDKTDPVAPTDIVIARPDSSMASSSWSASISSSTSINTGAPSFGGGGSGGHGQGNDSGEGQSAERKVSIGNKMTLFGSTEVDDPNGLRGTFYDLKRFKSGSNSNFDLGPENYSATIRQFTEHDWDEKYLQKYWAAPNNLYMHCLYINDMDAAEAPKVFNVKTAPSGWVVFYKGYVTPASSGTYRFYARCDDLILVRINGKIVVDGSLGVGEPPTDRFGHPGKMINYNRIYSSWPEDKRMPEKAFVSVIGDWINMTKGTPYSIEIIIGERPGGGFCAYLLTEKKGTDSGQAGIFCTDANLPSNVDVNKGVPNTRKAIHFKVVPAPAGDANTPASP